MEVEKCSSSPPSPPALISRNTGPPLYPVHVEYSSHEKRDGRRTHSPSQESEKSRQRNDLRLSREEGSQRVAMPSITRERSNSARGDVPTDVNSLNAGEEPTFSLDKNKNVPGPSSKSGKDGHHPSISKQSKDSGIKVKPGAGKSKQSPSIMSSLKSKKGISGASKTGEQNTVPRFVRRGPDSDSEVDDVSLHALRDTLRDSPSVESTTSTGSREGSQRQRKSLSKSQSDQSRTSGQRTNGTTTSASKPMSATKSRMLDVLPGASARTSALNGDSQAHRTSLENYDAEKVKRKRGRPPKQQPSSASVSVSRPLDLEHLNMSNVSPDSGIQSIGGSPLTHDREVPSPGHHPAIHPVPTAAAHPGLHFPEFLPNPANFNAFHRLYPHLNPSIASLYPPPFASPFFLHPAVNNFQQAFLNFTNNQRFSSIANASSVDHSPVKQPEIPRSKSSEELNIPAMKLQSGSNKQSKSVTMQPDKHDKQGDKHAKVPVTSSKPASNAKDQVDHSKEPIAPPVKKRVGRPRKHPELIPVQSSSQEPEIRDRSDGTLSTDSGATDSNVTDRSKHIKSSSSSSTAAKSSPKHSQVALEKPKRGRPPKDALRHKHGQLKSTSVSTPATNPLDYLTTVPVATNSLPGSTRKTNELLSVTIPSAQSLIPKDSAIALATSFPGIGDLESGKTPPHSSPSQAQLSSRAATNSVTTTATSPTTQALDSTFGASAIGLPPKKKRGRPRKNPLPEDLESPRGTLSPKSTTSQQSRDSTVSPNSSLNIAPSAISPALSTSSTTGGSSVPIIPKTTKKTPIVAPSSFGQVPLRPAPASFSRKRYKSGAGSDAEILSLAQNIHESINAQFPSEDELNSSSENLERSRSLQRNIFTDINHDFQHNFHGRLSLLPKQQTRPEGSAAEKHRVENNSESGSNQGSESPKKKTKKPKLHVMMRKPKKRGRKKKVTTLATPAPESPATAPGESKEEEINSPPRASNNSPKKRAKSIPALQKSPTISKVRARVGKRITVIVVWLQTQVNKISKVHKCQSCHLLLRNFPLQVVKVREYVG